MQRRSRISVHATISERPALPRQAKYRPRRGAPERCGRSPSSDGDQARRADWMRIDGAPRPPKGPIAGRSSEALSSSDSTTEQSSVEPGPYRRVGAMGQNNCDAQVTDAALGHSLTQSVRLQQQGLTLDNARRQLHVRVRRVSTRLNAQVDHLDRDHGRRRRRRHLHAPLGQEGQGRDRGETRKATRKERTGRPSLNAHVDKPERELLRRRRRSSATRV